MKVNYIFTTIENLKELEDYALNNLDSIDDEFVNELLEVYDIDIIDEYLKYQLIKE